MVELKLELDLELPNKIKTFIGRKSNFCLKKLSEV